MTDGAALLRAVGLLPDGPVVLGRPARAAGSGVYVVELPDPLPTAPIELTRVGKWLERVPDLRLDGTRPTSKALAARLAGFWLPAQTVLFVGSTAGSIGARLTALDQHVLGDPRPHAAAQWLKALTATGLRAWWAATEAPEEYEDAVLEAFADGVAPDERAALVDASVVLPFANLRRPTGERKQHGISGAVLPVGRDAPAPPTRVVSLPPGDADGARVEPKGTGTVRRAPREVPAAAGRPGRPAKVRPPAATARTPAPSVELTADGAERLRAELDELVRVRRPQVVARIRAAKELGDLKENADYTAAREEQSFLEGRVQALEATLRTAVIAGAVDASPHAALGSRVVVERDGERLELQLVGSAESNPGAGRISVASPVGRALLGTAVGDEAIARTPGGEIRLRVLELS